MDTAVILVIIVFSIFSFFLGKYWRMVWPLLSKFFSKQNNSPEPNVIKLERMVLSLEDEIAFNPLRLKSFLDLTRIGIWQYKVNAAQLEINNTTARMFGFESVDMLKMESFLKLIVGLNDLQNLINSFNGVLSTKKEYENIIQILSSDGQLKTLKVTMGYGESGSKFPLIIGNIQEVQGQVSEVLLQEQFRLVADSITDGIYIFEKGKLIFVSDKIRKGFEPGFFDNENLTDHDLFKFVHPEDVEQLVETLKRAKDKKMSSVRINFRLLPNPSTVIYREDIVNYYYNENGEILKTIVIAKDISELRNAKTSISFEAIMSMGLIDNFPGFLAVKNYDGEFIFANRNASEMFGVDPNEMIGRRDTDYNSFPELIQKYQEDDRKVIDTGQSLIIPKEKGIRRIGGVGYFQTIKIPVSIPGQEKKCVLLFAIDITDRVRQEDKEAEQRNKIVLRNKILFELSNSTISQNTKFSEKCKRLTEALTKGLDIEFASIWEVNADQITCLDNFSKSRDEHNITPPLALSQWQPYVDILENDRDLLIPDVFASPLVFDELKNYYTEHGIQSTMNIPLRLGNEFKGVICCEHTLRKEWDATEIAFARHIGNIKETLYEQELRKDVEKKLIERTEILRVTAEVSQLLQQTSNLEMSLDGILEKIGIASNSSRVYYFTNNFEGGYFRQEKEWVNIGVKSEMQNESLQSLAYSKLGRYYDELKNGRPFQFVISDIDDEEHYQRLFLQGIKSQLVIPVMSMGVMIGFIGFDDCENEKVWGENYINLLVSIGASLGLAIEKFENEKQKEESQNNFKQISDALEEVFWLFDLQQSKFLLISRACYEVFGIYETKGYLDYQFIEKLILQEDVDKIKQRKNGFEEGVLKDLNYKIKTPMGEIRIINEKISPIYDEQGQLVKISGIARDVTEKVTIDNEIQRLSVVVQKINNSILISDVEAKAIWANNAYLNLLEVDWENLKGKRPSDLFELEDKAYVLENTNFNSKNHPIEFKIKTFKGNWIWVEMTSTILYDSQGKPTQIVEIINDITERKRNELQLIENESRLRFITENTSDGFMIFNDLEIVYYSSQCEKIFGYPWQAIKSLSSEEIIGLIHNDDLVNYFEVVQKIPSQSGQNIFFQLRIRHNQGHYFWVEICVNAVTNQEGFPTSAVVVVRNIDQRKNMELALKDSEQKLTNILNSLDEVVWALEYPSLKPLFVSESIKNIYGVSSKEWKKDDQVVLQYTLPEDEEIVRGMMRKLGKTGHSNGVFRIKVKDKIKWIASVTKVVKGPIANSTMLIGTLNDITKIKEAESEAVLAKQETEIAQNAYSELELRALQMQMNPHFIFNALNSIQSYIINKEEQMANTYLTKFAALIRQFLDSSRSKYISLDEEITNLNLYVELEKLRFENKFDYVFDLDPKVSKYSEIPTMLLQPFIENAINHGLRYRNSKGMLRVSFIDNGRHILVKIQDNGVGRVAAEKIKSLSSKGYKSQGLKITAQRIENYNKLNQENIEYKISDLIENSENIGTLVEIYFPKI
ncbi:PAS domain S-box protein [Lacihabitans soyangensis]|uniref:histidine kinase n=2 Tax=Lacihabitans soyangensis TaxID=869394 RepID=A0AAE3KRB5_9BACT|nr:PAS domain S-box protein [Lacihabitans soyangensis]